jgi:hypothetical protein
VRRTVVLVRREHLRDQHEQDHLPGGVCVPPRPTARTQGHQEQGGEFAPQQPIAYATHARRIVSRLLAVVLA